LFLPVVATLAGDLEVRLPTRPNGSTTWIGASNLRLYHSPYRIVVDLASRHLLLYRNEKLVLNAPAGVGTASDPTPTGHFFVASFATAPTPAYGPFVIVTSAHSEAISDWEESGDAVVAIHGPLGEDAEIGKTGARISHGCIRLHDGDLALLRAVPDGSPIDIIA
jgi:lipoprotein-anchoring transpeptidase ErfK/SrfK